MEFQAVILAAGRGSRMLELTSERPKCLLPVGPDPLLIHSLKLLESAGFKEALVVVLDTAADQVSSTLSHYNLKLNFELVTIPADSCEDLGTADAIRLLFSQGKLHSNVLLLSCDLITNGNLNDLLNSFRKHGACLAALFFPPSEHTDLIPEKDIVGIDPDSSRLVMIASASDFQNGVPIKRILLKRHKSLNIRTDLVDGHCYVLSFKLIQYLMATQSFSSLKGDFLPYVVSKQYKKLESHQDEENEGEKLSGLYDYLKENKAVGSIWEASSYNDHKMGLNEVYNGDSIRCFTVLASNSFGHRINNYATFWQANFTILNQPNTFGNIADKNPTDIQTNQIDNSFVGANSKIEEKTSIRRSIIGKNCHVKPKTRIVNSIIFNNVECQGSCVVENCIIGDNVKIGEGSELKNCIVGANHVVERKSKVNSQLLAQSDQMMEI